VWNGPVYDCQQCGACCANHASYPAVGYVYLNTQESKQMKRLGLSVVRVSGDAYLGTRTHVGAEAHTLCVAFRGAVGDTCACSIYASRPQGCRRFEAGSPLCRTARAEAGLPA
jgi:uncharacterized protein